MTCKEQLKARKTPKKSQKSIYTRNRMCYHTDNKNTDTPSDDKKGGTDFKELFKRYPEKVRKAFSE